MNSITSLEKTVLDKLLKGENWILSVLREQLKFTTVSSRKNTGVGFYTTFVVSVEASPVVGLPTFRLGDVNGKADNVKHGISFLLHIINGNLSMLEGYTYEEPWPSEILGLVLSYSNGEERSVEDLRNLIKLTIAD